MHLMVNFLSTPLHVEVSTQMLSAISMTVPSLPSQLSLTSNSPP